MLHGIIMWAALIAYLVFIIYLSVSLFKDIVFMITTTTIDSNRWIVDSRDRKKVKDISTTGAVLSVVLSSAVIILFLWLAYCGLYLLVEYLGRLLTAVGL